MDLGFSRKIILPVNDSKTFLESDESRVLFIPGFAEIAVFTSGYIAFRSLCDHPASAIFYATCVVRSVIVITKRRGGIYFTSELVVARLVFGLDVL